MFSVGFDRASRGLTAIPSMRRASRNRGASRRGPAERRAAEEGFLGPRGAPASPSARKVGTGFRNSRCVNEVAARGRNPTDPLKARQPYGRGRHSAGPRARPPERRPGRTGLRCHAAPSPTVPSSRMRWQECLGVFRRDPGSQIHSEPVESEPAQVLVKVAEFGVSTSGRNPKRLRAAAQSLDAMPPAASASL